MFHRGSKYGATSFLHGGRHVTFKELERETNITADVLRARFNAGKRGAELVRPVGSAPRRTIVRHFDKEPIAVPVKGWGCRA